MGDPFLLVPITIEALLVGSRDLRGNWSLAAMDFDNLSIANQAPTDPDPGPNLTTALPDASTGIHLHWALPDALTHGRERDAGAIEYPYVPNRWLVMRMFPDAAQTASRRAMRSWVIESDYVDPTAATSSFPAPFADPNHPDVPPPPTRIGRVIDAALWTETGTAPLFLRAPGPGHPAFAAFYPNVRNVFGFHDDLSDLAQASAADPLALTYLVFGWYSDPHGDPLSSEVMNADPEGWRAFLDTCQWSLADAPLPSAPARVLCHGTMVFPAKAEADNLNEPWSGAQETSYIPATNPVMQLAIGNSAVEALSALLATRLQDTSVDVERLLDAFQYNVLAKLDEADGDGELTRTIHQMSFGSRPSESRWNVTFKSGDVSLTAPAGQRTPSLTDDQWRDLGALNDAEKRIAALRRQLESRQRALYALWWKKLFIANVLGRHPIGSDADYPTLIRALEQQIGQLQTAIDGTLAPDLVSRHAKLSASLDATLQLVEESAPRFWRASDPVVLVAGAGRNYKHGEDGRFSEDGTLRCRWIAETIASLTVPADHTTADRLHASTPTATITGADLKLRIPSAGPAAREIEALTIESFLLDWRNAAALAALPGPAALGVTADTIQTQQMLPWNAIGQSAIDARSLQAHSGLAGVLPSKVGFTIWTSPWSPLFLDWTISWSPTYTDPSQPLAAWRFDADSTDYTYAGGSAGQAIACSGRTLLTPHVTKGLQTCLENFAQGDTLNEIEADLDRYFQEPGSGSESGSGSAAIATFQDLIEAVKNWDVLSQSLGGLTELLVQRQPAHLANPYDAADPDLTARVGEMYDRLPRLTTQAHSPFFAVRAGFFQFTSLFIVDGFGHAIDVLRHAPALPVRSAPLLPAAANADSSKQSAFLAPRLAQHSRLSLDLRAADDDAKDVGTYPIVNPICGWLLPNHLTGELAVFDADGQSLGQLVTVQEDPPWVRWDPVPGTAGTSTQTITEVDISNPHLRRFAASLLRPDVDAGRVLSNLLQAIDRTLWTVDPQGERGNERASALIGRPLAVVRAGLQLELDAEPIDDLSWINTGSTAPPAWTGAAFPVRLGDLTSRDDGLIGFCRDDELQGDAYASFHAVAPSSGDPAPDSQGSFIDEDNVVPVTPQAPDATGASPPALMLVLLIDPRAGVSAASGILPAVHVALPAEHVAAALAKLTVTFRTGPILREADQLSLPMPAGINGSWSWIQRPAVGAWETVDAIQKANDRARLSDAAPVIAEGWLQLRGAVDQGQ